ncbi:MAG: signal recognition particle-docking protein FtsY, partial [Alphaproteobacteria bacterium]|nr:signal recognition particle-docking protein FtsY [Alphaproteobacteria bacterium]
RTFLADEITKYLSPVAQTLQPDRSKKPFVVLVVGVNGSGKTTTIAKLGAQLKEQGLQVSFAAGDTFRAAAVEQLSVWGNRLKISVEKRELGADAAGLAYDALEIAKNRGDDVLLIDTAGRLHTNANLMAELQKIQRVLKKVDPKAPHMTLLVLDATIGQNAYSQIETFKSMTDINGLIITKLDGTAKGGVIVGLTEKYSLPIFALGVGEKVEDLRPFKAEDFALNLLALEKLK